MTTDLLIEKPSYRILVDGKPVYQPHDGQKAFHETDAHTRVLKWARRAGKDRAIVSEVLFQFEAATRQPYRADMSIPFHCVYVVPNYRLASQPWSDLKAYIPPGFLLHVLEDERKIYLIPQGECAAVYRVERDGTPVFYGGLIEIRSADNKEGMQGFGADVLVIFEAQEISRALLTLLEPTLTDPFRRNLLIVQGIPPEDPDHWMNDYFAIGQEAEGRRKGYFSSLRTYLQNPWNTPEILERIGMQKRTMREVDWNRMYMAEDPPANERPMNIEPCLVPAVQWEKQRPQDGHIHDIGVDLGKTMSATVITIWDKHAFPWRLAYYRRMMKASWPVVKAAVIQLQDVWAPRRDGKRTGRVYVDSSGLDPIYEDLRLAQVPVMGVKFTGGIGQERERLLDKLAIAIEKRMIRVPQEDQIIKEFNTMRRVLNDRNGRTVWQPLDGATSDCVFSFALGLYDLPVDSNIIRFPRKPAMVYGASF